MATALILAEMAPEYQDTILRRGYQMGYSGVITGQRWATDIMAARIMAAGVVARLHADPEFIKLLEKARNEYSNG